MAAQRLLSPYYRNLIAVMATMTAATLSYSFVLPLLSIALERQGISNTLIGLNGAAGSAAIFVVAPFAPRLLVRFGPVRVTWMGVTALVAALLLMPVFPNVWAWFPLRVLGGAGGGLMWIVGEAWINQTVAEHTRGRILSLYTMSMSLGYAIGPLLLVVTGSDGWTPFLAGAGVVLAAGAAALVAAGVTPALEGTQSARLHGIFRLAPLAMTSCFVISAADALLVSMLPLYGTGIGLVQSEALYLLTMVGIGGIVLQYPFGWLADHMDRRQLTLIVALLMFLGSLALPWALPLAPYNLIFAFVYGGLIGALYTMGNILMGERFRGADLAAASTVFAVMGSLGTLAGPPAGGLGMDLWPVWGLPMALTVIVAMVLPFAISATMRRPATEPSGG